MKKLSTFIIIVLGVLATQAQNIAYTLLTSNQNEAIVRVDFGSYQTETVSVNGVEMQKLHMEGAYPMLTEGSPELLQTAFSLIVPEGSSPETEILDAQYTTVKHFALAPSKGKLYRNVDPATVAYTMNQEYQYDKFLLGSSIILGEQYQLRDFHGINVQVYPFDYNPVSQTLIIYSSVTVKVTFNGTRALPTPVKNNRTFDAVYASHFMNYKGLRSSPVAEEGDILIIAPEDFMEDMQPYADWKIRNGYNTEIVPLTTAGSNSNDIKSFISDYYNDHNLAFVIIVGDNAQFPTPTVSGDKSDNYYTELAGNDYYPDIILGKISAENVAQVQTQVQRFIEYEQNPTETSHFSSFMGIASAQNTMGDNNEHDYEHVRLIDEKLQAYTYTSGYELFDGSHGGLDASGSPTSSMVAEGVNNGVGIISYCGHGNTGSWGTSGFNNNNVNALTNADKLPFIISVACLNGEYHSGTCFAEAWLRATYQDRPSGAVCFLGSTISQPWNSPMCAQDAMIDYLVGTTPEDRKFTFGGVCFNGMIHMLDVYHDKDVSRTWLIFGDPTLQLRTAAPQELAVSHNEAIPVNHPSITFTSEVENAKITVTKDNEIIGTGRIQNGEFILDINDTFLSTDTLNVLATATNYLPYEGKINFIPNEGAYVIISGLNLTDESIMFVNNRPNDLPEFGKVLKVTPQIANLGNDPASNVLIKISTEDEYISLIGNQGPCTHLSVTIPIIAAHDTLTDDPDTYFYFKVADVVPAKHNSPISIEIICDDDTLRQSQRVTLYAPTLTINAIEIDDAQLGNGNHRMDFNETVNCKVTISNTGNMPIIGGAFFMDNPGNELILQSDSIHFPAIGIDESVTISFPITANSSVQIPTTSYLTTGLWVNFFHAYAVFPIAIGLREEDWETGDFNQFIWQNNSDSPWTISTYMPYEGVYCAKSGAIGDNNSTEMRITDTVYSIDTISFYYKVSSEQNYDKLKFLIDGQIQGEWSGVVGWKRAAFPVTEGVHTFTWAYIKDNFVANGQDCAYIDNILFPGGKVNHPVGVDDFAPVTALFRSWPNPTTGILHIQLNEDADSQDYTYQLFSFTGKLLQGGRLSDFRTEIDMTGYVSGVYVLKIEDRQHQSQTTKIVKK
jgi:hypothetical protein